MTSDPRIFRSTSSGVASWIEENLDAGNVTGEKFMGGSSWSSCYLYETSSGWKYFAKVAPSRPAAEMFEGEALGLQAMHATHTLKIPEVFHCGDLATGGSFILMEQLNMSGRADPEKLGELLAQMHLAEPSDPNAQAGRFGFGVDNTIGGTPQPNAWCDNWVEFFRERRLRHQLRLAGDAELSRMGDKLCSNLGKYFDGIDVKPSILHGDLWSGNITAVDGQPCIFDPAAYYGHHEAEFGMSWCAGFGRDFWDAYFSVIPKAEPGWAERHEIYTLYHYLNHYNMFGGSYKSQCVHILQRLTR